MLGERDVDDGLTRRQLFARDEAHHTPLGIQIDEKNPNRSRCIRCTTCDGFPCLVGAKADAQVLAVDPALEFPNVTLLTNALVERLETIPSGRAVRIGPRMRTRCAPMRVSR